MKRVTLISIQRKAMDAKANMLYIGYDRKYEWHLWGYLLALFDNDIIDYNEYIKIKKHYRKYFRELRKIQPKLELKALVHARW